MIMNGVQHDVFIRGRFKDPTASTWVGDIRVTRSGSDWNGSEDGISWDFDMEDDAAIPASILYIRQNALV